jgi:protein required for attachment to host cells
MHHSEVHFLFISEEVGLLEELKILVDLQSVDSQLLTLEKAKGDLPKRVFELKLQWEQAEQAHRQKKRSARSDAKKSPCCRRRFANGQRKKKEIRQSALCGEEQQRV